MSSRPFELLLGQEGSMVYEGGGTFGSEATAVKRAHESLLGLVRYGYADRARAIVRGPGVLRRLRARPVEPNVYGAAMYDPARWTVEDHEDEIGLREQVADRG